MRMIRKLKTERLVIRQPEKKDANDIFLGIDKDVIRFLSNVPWPYEKKHAYMFINKSNKEWGEKSFKFVIEMNKKVIGTISLTGYDKKNKKAELGYWLAKQYWGKGIMTEAANEVMRFGFEDVGLIKIIARSSINNIGSNKVLKKIGMKRLCILKKDYVNVNGGWEDSYLYEILKEDFLKIKKI